MTLKQRKLFWFFIWLLVIISGPITVLRNIRTAFPPDYLILINIFQRVTGLLAFCLMFAQLMLGSFMGRWVQILGAKAYWVHIRQGLLAYGFILIHPLLQIVLTQEALGVFNSILTLLPNYSTRRELWISFGRMGFALLAVSVFAGYFRTKPFMRRNWLKFHILNYVAFYIIAIHAWFTGTDTWHAPFVWVFWIAVTGVSLSIVYRVYTNFLTKIKPVDKLLGR